MAPATNKPGLSQLHAQSAAEACLGRTCLQWQADGELAETDASLIRSRLRAVDPALAALCGADLD